MAAGHKVGLESNQINIRIGRIELANIPAGGCRKNTFFSAGIHKSNQDVLAGVQYDRSAIDI